jgi:hypothetical protein
MTLRWGDEVTALAEQKKITGEAMRRVRKKAEEGKNALEDYRNRRIIPFASLAKLDLSDPDVPRWLPFPEGRYTFRVDYVPAKREYLLRLHRSDAKDDPLAEGQGPCSPDVDGPDNTNSRVGALQYNQARPTWYKSRNITALSRAFVRNVRDNIRRVGSAASALSDRCRQALLDGRVSPEQRAVAAALISFLTPQNVAPALVSRLRRETVRISEHFRLELLKPISASPFGLWQPDMFGEPQLDIGRLYT